jgi:hypothetical protein
VDGAVCWFGRQIERVSSVCPLRSLRSNADTPQKKAQAYFNARFGLADDGALEYALFRTESLAIGLVLDDLAGVTALPPQDVLPWWIAKKNIAVDLSWYLGVTADVPFNALSLEEQIRQADNFVEERTYKQVAMPRSDSGRNGWSGVVSSLLLPGEHRVDAPPGIGAHAEEILIWSKPDGYRIFGLASWRPFCTGFNGCLPLVKEFADTFQALW